MSSRLIPCHGCGTLFPPYEGPTHRYLGAAPACWALMLSYTAGRPPDPELLTQSSAPHVTMSWSQKDALALDSVWGDAYGGSWVKRRALRTRGVFHKLEPPPLGCALTMRHLYPIEEADTVVTRSDYAYSVYNAWMGLHRTTVESWYERHVVRD